MNPIKFFVVLLIYIGINNTIIAQNDTVKLDHFRLPTTPAATILNMGANAISRPTTPQGVATSLISGFGGVTGIQPNITLEFAPFWLKPRRDLDFYTYYGLDKKNITPIETNVIDNIRQTFSVSVATTKLGDQKDTLDGTRLAVGLRAQIFSGKASSEMKNAVLLRLYKIEAKNVISSSLRQVEAHDLDESDTTKKIFFRALNNLISFDSLVFVIKSEINVTLGFYKGNLNIDTIRMNAFAIMDQIQKDVLRKKTATSQALVETIVYVQGKSAEALELQAIKQTNKNKVGFIWEIAGAGVQYFPQNSFERSVGQKTGLWSTMSYRSDNQKSELTMLIRQTFSTSDSVNANFDFGFSATRIVDERFNYGVELIYRSYSYRFPTKDINGNNIKAIESGNTYRLAMNMEYKISDVVSITASVGKDFNGPFIAKNNLLSVIGANFSLPALAGLGLNSK